MVNCDFLLGVADELESRRAIYFDMEKCVTGNLRSRNPVVICGSVCCPLGRGLFVEPPVMSDYEGDGWEREFCPINYSNRVCGFSRTSFAWYYCFGAMWKKVDNTPRGAALRLKKLAYQWNDRFYDSIRIADPNLNLRKYGMK